MENALSDLYNIFPKCVYVYLILLLDFTHMFKKENAPCSYDFNWYHGGQKLDRRFNAHKYN